MSGDLRSALEAICAEHWDWKAGQTLHQRLKAALAEHPAAPAENSLAYRIDMIRESEYSRGWEAGREWEREHPPTDETATIYDDAGRRERIYLPGQDRPVNPYDVLALEQACEVMHDAYETAAILNGWATQERSRVPWADVPEANKSTMRAAVRALIDHLGDPEPEAVYLGPPIVTADDPRHPQYSPPEPKSIWAHIVDGLKW